MLNENQQKVVEYNGNKPLLVEAGPGSGKTRVIIERVKFLINELKVNPSSLLVIILFRLIKVRYKLYSILVDIGKHFHGNLT